MGLPAVLHAKNDVLILESMEAAEKAGTLGPAQSAAYLSAAIRGVTNDIVVEAINRVQNDSLPVSVRRQALQEFGLTQDQADRSMFSGGQCSIYSVYGYRDFNGYALAGVETGL
jgi:ATPase subunit of ABC transporter with duplicated ATPase domains